MPKITRRGVSYEPRREPPALRGLGEATVAAGTGREMTAVEHPAGGTLSPPAAGEDGGEVRAAVTVLPPEDAPEPAPKPAPARAPRKAADG